MLIFRDNFIITIITTVLVIALIYATTRTNPITVIINFVRSLLTSRKYLFHFIALCCILIINKIEIYVEQFIPITQNFAELFHSIEGDFVLKFQQLFTQDWLTIYLAVFYVFVFPTLFLVSIALYTHERNMKLYYAICYAIIINYTVALPFYLFMPVTEVWSFAAANVPFQMLDVFPNFEHVYRPNSGIDNCFPSVHTSISVTVAIIAYRSGNRVWKWFTAISAASIIFAIFYMGIHWFTDMVGGVLLAIFAAAVGLRLSERYSDEAYTLPTRKSRRPSKDFST